MLQFSIVGGAKKGIENPRRTDFQIAEFGSDTTLDIFILKKLYKNKGENNMKRTTKSLIALLVLVAMCVSFCVPVFATEPAAEHELTCPCEGKTHTLEGLGLTHDQAVAQGYLVKNVAVCGEDGYSIYKCIVCPGDAYFLDNYVPAINVDHIFDETKTTTNPATCYNPGSVNKYCTRCEQWINETLPALGHVWEREGASEESRTEK